VTVQKDRQNTRTNIEYIGKSYVQSKPFSVPMHWQTLAHMEKAVPNLGKSQ
jgi:hypothetical protein